MPYKIVFQGGGAKLFPLLSAVEALQEHIKSENGFSVDMVAGASAGAIAAMLIAADVDCQLLKDHFKTKQGKTSVLSAFPQTDQLSVLRRIMFGQTVFDRSKLEDLLFKILSLSGFTEKKGMIQLKTVMKIAITDLKKSNVDFVELNHCTVEELVRNVADSCSIPFIFKNHKSKVNWEYVDGGLFENFPVSSIIENIDESRKVLGFTFEGDKKNNLERNPTLIEYLKILMSTAIDANIEASLRLLGSENIFSIKSEISTLDFRVGLEQFIELDNRLENLRSNIKIWIEDIVRRESEIDETILAGDRSLVPTNFEKFKESAGLLYQLRRTPNLNTAYSLSYMQINSIFGESSPNRNKFEYLYRKSVFEIPEEGVECFSFGTAYISTIDAEKYSDIEIIDDNGNELNFIALPISNPKVPREFVSLGVFLDKRIFPTDSSKLVIVQKQFIADCFLDLATDGKAHIEMHAAPEGTITQARMFVGLPKETAGLYKVSILSNYHEEIENKPQMVDANTVDDHSELKDILSPGTQIFGYEVQGQLTKGSALVIKVEKHSSNDSTAV